MNVKFSRRDSALSEMCYVHCERCVTVYYDSSDSVTFGMLGNHKGLGYSTRNWRNVCGRYKGDKV